MLPDNSGPNVTMATNAVDVMLGPADIPGADLNEPFETHVVPALRWWLLCRGIGSSSSSRKQQLQAVNLDEGLSGCIILSYNSLLC
jgi:hypothetical protein